MENGFDHIKYSKQPNHKYYEGYFHALSTTSGPFVSINPRSGLDFDKPAAPVRLRAFVEAFRRVNDAWIHAALSGGNADDADDADNDDPVRQGLWSLYKQGHHFADLAIQYHFGEEIGAEQVHWHKDSVNSALHLAVSLQGRRALHTRHSTTPDEANANADSADADHDPAASMHKTQTHTFWQEPGDVYVSTPYVFGHGVQYEGGSWGQHVIAIQCRFLIQHVDIFDLAHKSMPIAKRIAKALAHHLIHVPDLELIRKVEREIMNQH